jgi:hypothetical protein
MGPDGLIKIAAANSPRFDHSYNPATGEIESLGLLVEEARTNLLLRSEEFDNAYWSKVNVTVSTESIQNPYGSNSLIKLITLSNPSTQQYLTRNISYTSGLTYTLSFYVKKSERTKIGLFFPGAAFGNNTRHAWFDLDLGTVGGVESGVTATIFPLVNNFYRCSITATANATASGVTGIYHTNGGFGDQITGDDISGVYIWGSQLEAGAFPTSYIPTTASTVTRTADNASMVGENFSSWYNSSEGSIYTEAASFNPTGADNFAFVIPNGTVNVRGLSANFIGTTLQVRIRGESDGIVFENYVIPNGSHKKIILTHQNIVGASSVDGSIITEKTITPLLPASNFFIGSRQFLSHLNGTIKNITYYPKRLPNAFLQNLTK